MATMIAKEAVSKLNFIPADVDKTHQWKKDLAYAVRLGNEHKGKTNVTFLTSDGPYQVETTIWALTEDAITLKGGISIPLKSITDVHF